MSNGPPLTVAELIKALSALDPACLVFTEGCDCLGPAASVGLEKDWDGHGMKAVCIYRSKDEEIPEKEGGDKL